jgi:hypothetical protein
MHFTIVAAAVMPVINTMCERKPGMLRVIHMGRGASVAEEQPTQHDDQMPAMRLPNWHRHQFFLDRNLMMIVSLAAIAGDLTSRKRVPDSGGVGAARSAKMACDA